MNWTKITEILPKANQYVLIYGLYEHVIASVDNKGEWSARDTDCESGEPWLHDKGTVTHWMALPSPPNKSLNLTGRK